MLHFILDQHIMKETMKLVIPTGRRDSLSEMEALCRFMHTKEIS
jgi:hypothetical protein